MKKNTFKLLYLLSTIALWTACQEDTDPAKNNNETIKDMQVDSALLPDSKMDMGMVVDMMKMDEMDMDPNADMMADMDPNQDLNTPLIRRTRAYINRDEGGLGIEIIGRDEDNNVVGFFLEYFYDDGTALQLGDAPGPVGIKFSKLSQGNGDFLGTWSIPFIPNTTLDLSRLTKVQVSVLDETEYRSETVDIQLLNTPNAALGDECDLNRGLSRCSEGLLCDQVAGGRKKCAEAEIECPMGYEVIDLNANNLTYMGSTDGQPTYGVGACGGGTASNVFRFQASSAGSYEFIVTPTSSREDWLDEMMMPKAADSLMWIRSHCRFSDWIAELGCNDDINASIGDLRSRLQLDLTEGQIIFIFVDGYSELGMPGWSGGFEINVNMQ
jgi:hypothetical protein